MQTRRGARAFRRAQSGTRRLKLPRRRILSPLARPFAERAEVWKRVRIPEARPLRIAGGLILRRFTLPLPDAAMRKTRIAYFSDLHFHDTEVERRRISALAAAFRELRPEALLTGGDLTGDACDLPLLETVLRQLADSVPQALAIPGNWVSDILLLQAFHHLSANPRMKNNPSSSAFLYQTDGKPQLFLQDILRLHFLLFFRLKH